MTPRYEIPCRVHGEILVGDERIQFDGWGQRDHSWGAARDWWTNQWCWTAGRLDDGTRWHTAGGFFPGEDWGVGYELPAGSDRFVEGQSVKMAVTEGRERLPTRTREQFCGLDLEFEPLAFSPVLLEHPDGRAARFPRAMARVHRGGRPDRRRVDRVEPAPDGHQAAGLPVGRTGSDRRRPVARVPVTQRDQRSWAGTGTGEPLPGDPAWSGPVAGDQLTWLHG